MSFAIGGRVGPYEILAPLGAGGMADVWKARDTRLDRVVAIKRLHTAHMARFEQEARAIAALNHPHICQVYDIGPDYLVLEYVDGRPLAGPLPPSDAVRLALQIVSALEAAHERGILHRDLKPANVMVSHERNGSAKLLDFGLAKSIEPDADVTRTTEGTVAGTLAYMSPEQARGKPVDARSDIFSFGAVLYEMLSGRRAFEGETAAQVLTAVLQEDPPPLQTSPALNRVVRRCLAKDPDARFGTMTEVHHALEQHPAARPPDERPSIAVLPFVDMSPGRENDYFGDGLAEEIISALAQIPGLKVIARTSAFAFKGQNADIRRIAGTLGVSTVLEGSVRRAGNRLRVTAQLVAADDGRYLWSERFDRELADIFAVQDDITAAISSALKMRLTGTSAARRHVPTASAYDAYLKARHFLARETPEGFERGRIAFEEATALDAEFALAHSWLAQLYAYTIGFGLRSAHETMPLVRAHARRAVELDPSLSEAHSMLGLVAAAYDYDWVEAARSFGLATAGDPVPSLTRFNHALHYLLPLGRSAEAIEQLELGLRDDPLHVVRHVHLSFACAAAGRFEDAARATARALELDERSWVALFMKSLQDLSAGHVEDALSSIEQAYSIAPWNPPVVGLYAGLLSLTGQTARADALLRPLAEGDVFGAPFGLLMHALIQQDMDRAAYWVRKSIEQRDINIQFIVRQPGLAPLRRSPHWPGIAAMMNLPDSATQSG